MKERGIMAIELPDARQLSDPVLEALRLRALHGCELGFHETQLAELLGLRRETVCRWWSAYQKGGLDAIPQDRDYPITRLFETLVEEKQAINVFYSEDSWIDIGRFEDLRRAQGAET